jgi:hypothetical protein
MGAVYGYIFSAYMFGASLCPFLMGLGYEWAGSYTLALATATALMAASTFLVLRLGPYPQFGGTASSDYRRQTVTGVSEAGIRSNSP